MNGNFNLVGIFKIKKINIVWILQTHRKVNNRHTCTHHPLLLNITVLPDCLEIKKVYTETLIYLICFILSISIYVHKL